MSRTGDKFKHTYKRMLNEWRLESDIKSHLLPAIQSNYKILMLYNLIPKDYSTVVTLQLCIIGFTIMKYDSVNQ